MKRYFLIFALLASITLAVLYTKTTISTQTAPTTAAKPVFLASIKPVQLILQAIVHDTARVELLLSPTSNPHHYQMRPSELKKLHSADHFFWVGPGMEVFLPKILASNTIPSTSLMSFLDVDKHEETDNHDDETHNLTPQTDDHADHEDEHKQGHDVLHAGEDPHIWLDPLLIVEISAALANELGNMHPHLKSIFANNQQAFAEKVELLTSKFRVKLEQAERRPIFTAHNAFSRLAERFNLTIQDYVTQTPEMRPGASHLQGLQSKIESYTSICFIQESPTPSTYLKMISKKTNVKQFTIDILASDIQTDINGYESLIHGVLSDIERCSQL